MEASWRCLKPSKPTGYADYGSVRRIRVGQSRGQSRPFLSLCLVHAPGALPHTGRGRRIANACGDHRRPLVFEAGFFGKRICGGKPFWKVSLRRQVGRQILPKIFQKSSKDSLKSSQNRCLGVVLGGLGASWGGLGASWGVLGRPGGVLGASWGHLGGVLGRLGVVLGPSWGVLGASWARLGGS